MFQAQKAKRPLRNDVTVPKIGYWTSVQDVSFWLRLQYPAPDTDIPTLPLLYLRFGLLHFSCSNRSDDINDAAIEKEPAPSSESTRTSKKEAM
jgi:hypothetical protein